MPTHFELGLLIADRLGFVVDNPNQEEGIFYSNGVASYGMSGYMKIRKSAGDIPASVEVFH
jgi:hypothetical protein